MPSAFHLSLGVQSIKESRDFFVTLLLAKVTHRDPSGYVNIELLGNQITLKPNASILPNLPDFHFGINLTLSEFNHLAESIIKTGPRYVSKMP